MRKRSLTVLILGLMFIVLSVTLSFADSPNTDNDKAERDGTYTFSNDGEEYGYTSYLNADNADNRANFVGARIYEVTMPDAGHITARAESDEIERLTIEIESTASGTLVTKDLEMSGGKLSGSVNTELLEKGTYVVTFSYTLQPSSILTYDESGKKYFYHGITWTKITEAEAAAKKAAEEEAAKKAAEEEAAAKKAAEEEAAKKAAEEDSAATSNDTYNDSYNTRPVVAKKANTIKVKGKTVTIKHNKLKKKTQSFTVNKAFSISKAKGKVTYKKAGGNKKIIINRKTGMITIKKGLKIGTYKLKVKVTAAGNSSYKKATKTVTVKIRVK